MGTKQETYIRWLENLTSDDVSVVGGKNASLGEMLQKLKDEGIRVPAGFATTAEAYREFVASNEIKEKLQSHVEALRNDEKSLQEVGKAIRRLFKQGDFPEDLEQAIREAYQQLCERYEKEEILQLARWAAAIEGHYERPMDIEWAKDGESGDLFIVQARPETVQSQKEAGSLKTYRLKEQGEILVTGLAIGEAIAAGKVCIIKDADEMDRFEDDAILVTGMTDPDWVPIMKRASGIVTDYGGRTSHAAIVSRELGVAAVVGAGDATETLQEDQSEGYREGFALECRAIKRVREEIGLDNVVVMIPFCRTIEEADKVLEVMAEHGLERGQNDLQVYVMIEIPANVVLADQFGERFDGFSIGSNDLTQLVLGVDRDSEALSELFDERNEAVKRTISNLIEAAHAANTKVGICGQAPSDYPEFAAFLVEAGIDSISLNPDSVIEVIEHVAKAE